VSGGEINLGALLVRPGFASDSSMFTDIALSSLTCFAEFQVNTSLTNSVDSHFHGCTCGGG
jgi:hypothetical protein